MSYEQALATLRETLEGIDSDPELRDIATHRDGVLARYQPMFSLDGIKALTAEDFKSFLRFENNKHWKALGRLGPRITRDMERLQAAIVFLLDESVPVQERIDRLSPKGDMYVRAFGKAVMTPILHITYPDKYPVWNNVSQGAMKALGLFPKTPMRKRGLTYERMAESCVQLAGDLDTDLWTLDALWWRVSKDVQVAGANDETRVWVIRAGAEGHQESTALEKSVVVIDYDELGDLEQYESRKDLDAAWRSAHPEDADARVNALMSQAWSFVHEVSEGDIVLLPLKTQPGQIAVGEVTGEYHYERISGSVTHSCSVEWLATVPRDRIAYDMLPYIDLPRTVIPVTADGAARKMQRMLKRNINRADPVVARESIERFIRDAGARRATLRALAESIRFAHDISETGYTVNLHRHRVSMMVGSPVVLVITHDQVQLLVDETRLGEDARKRVEQWFYRGYDFRSIENEVAINVPAENIEEIYALVRDAHQAIMLASAETTSVPISARAFSPGVLEYMRQELGEDVPTPVHPPPRSRRRRVKAAVAAASLSEQTFELLDGLEKDPTHTFYAANRDDFKKHLIAPFREIMSQVALTLRPETRDALETEHRIFSRISKNDYGKGGAWPFYWAAFYPQGEDKTRSGQLAVWINHEVLKISFAFGAYASETATRFAQRIQENREVLKPIFSDLFGNSEMGIRQADDSVETPGRDWTAMLEPPHEFAELKLLLTREQVLELSTEQLVDTIRETFERVYPLMILATSEDPMPEIAEYLGIGDAAGPEDVANEEYSLEDISEESGFAVPQLESWVDAIDRKGQGVFYGPPGTGKTFVAERVARHLIGGGDGFMEIVQFHPAYAYEDFMQGLRPRKTDGGGFEFELVDGRFRAFCNEAKKRKGTCVMIVDEINRANLSRVFGELMYLLEYRDREVPLASGRKFRIPTNVRMIGTMNTADRSIAVVDHALRRRFAFIPLFPNYELLQNKLEDSEVDGAALVGVLRKVNNQINDSNYSIGISYFLGDGLEDHIESVWRMEIEPYLEEYFFDRAEIVDDFRWEKVRRDLGGTGEPVD